MNNEEFQKAIFEYTHGAKLDISFLTKWFESTISQLNSLYKQQKEIKHPRYRGDAREDAIISILKSIVPNYFSIDKGYVVNTSSSIIKEQDILVMDGSCSSSLAKLKNIGYYPVHAVLSSIEVKSNLNYREARKSIINCLSLKTLNRVAFSEEYENFKLCYSIFAYESTKYLKTMSKEINTMCSGIHPNLRPNSIYILGKGALIPAKNGTFQLNSLQIFEDSPFSEFTGIRTKLIENSEASAFLYFLFGIVDHCINEISSRKKIDLMNYFISPIIIQHKLEEIIEEQKKDLPSSQS